MWQIRKPAPSAAEETADREREREDHRLVTVGDAGAFNEGDWQALPEKIRTQLRVFARSRPIERGLIAFRSSLEPATRAKLEEVMLALDRDESGLAALTKAAGITRFERLTTAQRQAVLDWASVLMVSRGR